MFHQLEVRSLILEVNLGVTEEERETPQDVAFSIQIRFRAMPLGCQTDDVHDSIDYAALCALIEDTIRGREFKLIESLAHAIFHNLKFAVGTAGEVRLEVHKLHPPVLNLHGGSVFTIGEF